jgi:hypothetical protein
MIKVDRLKNKVLSRYSVSDLNFFYLKGHPVTHKRVNFDVFKLSEEDYLLYITVLYEHPTTLKIHSYIFEHKIDYYAVKNSELNFKRSLGQGCGDEILSSDSLLLAACKTSSSIHVLERPNMFLFPNRIIGLSSTEAFY